MRSRESLPLEQLGNEEDGRFAIPPLESLGLGSHKPEETLSRGRRLAELAREAREEATDPLERWETVQ